MRFLAPFTVGKQKEIKSAQKTSKRSVVGRSDISCLHIIHFLNATLADWNEKDFRLFVGNLGREVTTEILSNLFRMKYPSFTMGRVVESKVHKGSAGYGFVAFSNALEGVKAMKEMNGKLCGSRPMKIQRSEWMKKEESVISFVCLGWVLGRALTSTFGRRSGRRRRRLNRSRKREQILID